MSFVVTVRFVSRPDSGQPEPFYIESGAEWPTLKLMLGALDGGDSQLALDVRYWDEEDYVILSSQEELDEALRLASETGLLQLYVKRMNDFPEEVEPSAEPTAPVVEEEGPKERAPKRRAEEAFTPEKQEDGSPVDPSASPSVTICLQAEDTDLKTTLYQLAAAACSQEIPLDRRPKSAPKVLAVDKSAMEAGAADQEHTMLPGAQSGANVIAIEMPECPNEMLQQGEGEHQGTEAAEPAEIAETGEMAHKSGRDAETGFWMVAKSEQKGENTQAKARPKQPMSKSPSQASQKKSEAKVSSSGNPDKSQRKKKHLADALTQEMFLDYMSKYKSEMRRDIVKDVTRKTVRQVVEGVGKLQSDQQRLIQSGREDGSPQERKLQWPICFHEKIVCDECEQTIVGPRYKCGNCTNYDLCEACETIYPPVHDSTHVFIKLRIPCPKAGIRHGERIPLLKRPVYLSVTEEDKKNKEKLDLDRLAKVKEKLLKKEEKLKRRLAEFQMSDLLTAGYGTLSAKFVADLTIPDDTVVAPGQCLEKKWSVRNNGTMSWPPKTSLELVNGNMRVEQHGIHVGAITPGEVVTLTVHVIAPEREGDCDSHWRLSNKGAMFGPYVFCKVRVKNTAAVDTSSSEPKVITPTCENPVVGFPPAAGAELPVVPEETFSEEGAAENPTQTQEEEESREKGEEDVTEKAVMYLQGLGRVEHPEGSSPHMDDGAEASDLWASDRFQAQPKLSGNGASTSPAVPSTPNNTPFAVSPPSGRCVSPLSTRLVHFNDTYEAFLEAQQLEGIASDEYRVIDSWMKEYLLETGSSGVEAAVEAQVDVSPAKELGTVESLPLLKLVAAQPSVGNTAHDETKQEDSDAEAEDDEDNSSLPELVFESDLVVCSCQHVAEDLATDAEQLGVQPMMPNTDAESGYDELLEKSKAEAAVGMPSFEPSFVMTSEDTEILASEEVSQDKKETLVDRQCSREMSPGSTVSSVEVVSVADLEDFEKEAKEEYSSIDTHGAWFCQGHEQFSHIVADSGREDGEGYEILPDEFSSTSGDSSSEEDFCIVMPPCFDTSKPLKRSQPSGRMEKLYNICLNEMERQNRDTNALFQDARENLDEVMESVAAKPTGHSEQAEEDICTAETSKPAEHSVAETEITESVAEVLAKTVLPPAEFEERYRLLAQQHSESEIETKVEQTAEQQAEEDEKYDISTELQQSNQQLDCLVDFLTSKMKRLGDPTPPEGEEKAEVENEVHDEEKDAGEPDSKTKETIPEDLAAKAEETEVKVKDEMDQEEEEEGAAAAAEILDPGQQLNQLMQSTVKAATSGLQHLYRTTKDVIKTLQADPYEVEESTYEFEPSSFVLPKSTWQPPMKQYVPPRNDFQPPKSDFQLPKSTYTGPKSPEISVSDEFAAPLMRIREMGYFNNERSIALLKKHKGDVHRVVDELCQDADNDWAANRH